MTGFRITTTDGIEMGFELYLDAAPVTSKAFLGILPFTRTFNHARVSGQEIWNDDVPQLVVEGIRIGELHPAIRSWK